MVSVLHKELECIEKKLTVKKLEVMQPRIKKKSVLSAGELTILDQYKWRFTVVIDNTVHHLLVKNNKGEWRGA